ncbi:NACHT domain-containing NTPase [uncultured Neglectibacter sp.]|uniref:NACHT domain-containing protein n=1 Tax=uncultured Neglectibacter sp. TaxID=1924108 RepID=UPI0034DFC4B1
MDVVVSNVGCSILASIIYDVSKVYLGKFIYRSEEFSIKKVEKLFQEKLDSKFEVLYMSGEFNFFIQTPFFKDTIENYIIYKVTGNCEGNILQIKKTAKLIGEKDVIDFLSDYLIREYYKSALNVPSKTLVRNFFENYFEVATNCIVSSFNDEDKMNVFLINRRIDFAQENILLRLNETIETINRTMKCEIIPVKDTYDDYVKKYHGILKTINSKAHVYLLDTFEFSEFYVPPFLRHLSSESEVKERTRLVRRDRLLYAKHQAGIETDDYFDDWKHIFDSNSIVYVTGGAGYGKSLFLKKIINDFCNMNILNSSEYLVIYGDLKSFYAESNQPVSIVKFLQNSMVKETLMDEKNFSVDMIEYYIKMGRCLLLFDALDEVEREKREELHKKIIAYFKNQNPNNKICITSRNRGFIPEKDVEVFDILPLDKIQIEAYVDNIIKLGRFDAKDKETFLEQSSILVDKGFLNSFLVLSLLINIYKAERELPENKMELYQKCFDYIAYRREKEKTKAKFNWDLISCMMKDNTFMELARMCFPNNNDVGKDEIVAMLCKTYRGKYNSDAETELAANHFLLFCSDRTELFVPAAGEDRFKFFHRSFFEYFYSQYIFLRIRDVKNVYKSLQQFDVDSEVFELTLAMMKQKDEPRYQKLMEYMFSKLETETREQSKSLSTFNILTLGMQVVDDNIYLKKYIDYLCQNSERVVDNIELIPNQGVIYSIIVNNNFIQQIIDAYGDYAKLRVVETLLEELSEIAQVINRKVFEELPNEEKQNYISYRFYGGDGNSFYSRLYIEYAEYRDLLLRLSRDELETLHSRCKISKRERERNMKLYNKYQAFDEETKEMFQNVISHSIHINKN